MSKKPRSTKGVPEAVFQRELKAYLERKKATPHGKNGKAAFTYNGVSYTFERGNGPYNSGYQLKTSSGQAAKEMARNEQKRSIKLSEGEKMFMNDKYAAAAERNSKENRKGKHKLEVDHVEPRSRGGLHHPYNLRLMERGDNIKKGNKQGGFGKFQSLESPEEFKKWSDNDTKRKHAASKGLALPPRIAFPGQSLAPSSGSQIVDRANGNMQMTGNAATLGVPLDLF